MSLYMYLLTYTLHTHGDSEPDKRHHLKTHHQQWLLNLWRLSKKPSPGLSPTTFFTVLAAGVTVYYILSVLFSGSSHRHQQHSPMSSEQDRSIADSSSSSSSSQSIPAWNHDVFLSFRGEDVRKNFVDHLYKDLVQQGIQTYKDDETLPRGDIIGPALLKAIQESRIAVVVFSQNYADSSWCLTSLHILWSAWTPEAKS
ncbi:putative TIR domain-containing protein [Helianthus annuus]|nr:putative TIR domain-containing protein [Helianthus annuus]